MRLIAHRGVSSLAPENTMAAFIKCLDIGVDWFEFDIHMIADGSVVVMHDDTLDRTTDLSGALEEKTFSQIRRADAGAWFDPKYRFERIPELSSVVELLNETALSALLEIKPLDTPEEREQIIPTVSKIAGEVQNQDKLIIHSFDYEALAMLDGFNIAYLVDKEHLTADFAGHLQRASDLGCVAFHPEVGGFTEEQVDEIHGRGMQVNVWTVNDLATGQQLRSWGADGVITDRPQDLASLVH